MRKIYVFLSVLVVMGLQLSLATTRNVPGAYATIQAAINASSNLDVVVVAAGTYNENVVVNKEITLQGAGATTIIDPTSGVGVSVTANNVTLTGFTVTGATNHGVYAGNVSGLTITNVEASSNGKSGFALQAVTGTSVLTNLTATSNPIHGLEIGRGSKNVNVVGGTFKKNGTNGDYSTGGGIAIYTDNAAATDSTIIRGNLSSDSNKTAGIYITCTPGNSLRGTRIGMIANGTNSGTVTLNDNGSTGAGFSGGGAVIVYGPASDTKIRANSTKTAGLSYETAGLIVVGTTNAGANSPTGTVAKDCNLTGFSTTSPAGTFKVVNAGNTLIGTSDVDATVGNTINGVTTGFSVEDLLKHKVDSLALGAFKGPGTAVYVTPNSGSIQRGLDVAQSYTKDTVYVKDGTYFEECVIKSSVTLIGQGASTIIDGTNNTSGNDNLRSTSINNINVENLTLQNSQDDGYQLTFGNNIKFKNVIFKDNHYGLYMPSATNASNISINGGSFSGQRSWAIFARNVTNFSMNGTVGISRNSGGVYFDPSSGINIGQNSGDNITISNSGKSAIYLQGGNSNINISATITKGDSNGVGITVVGDGTGQNTGVKILNSSFSGYSSTKPAITLADADSGFTGTNAVQITDANFNLTGGQTVADLLYDSQDNAALGGVTAAPASGILVKVKVYLEGAFNGATMNTTLATGTNLPLNQPYTAAPFSFAGTELETGSSFFTTNNIVDWVLVELRSTSSGAAVDRRAGLLKSDGTVVDVDGTTGLSFSTATAGDYFIVVKHRNHLAVMSAAAVTLPNASAYDFTTALGQGFGSNPMKSVSGGIVLFTGEAYDNSTVSSDGQITTNDFDVWLANSKAALTGYRVTDFNFDGQVTTADFDLWLPNAKVAATTKVP